MSVYVAHASKVAAEREDAANADETGPTYREEGYGPPSKEVLDDIPRREN